jgi:hypothetical protein
MNTADKPELSVRFGELARLTDVQRAAALNFLHGYLCTGARPLGMNAKSWVRVQEIYWRAIQYGKEGR